MAGGSGGAPEGLAVVQRFLNTLDRERDHDELRDDDALQRWLSSNGLLDPGEPLGVADLHHAIEAREALRALLAGNNRGRIDAETVAILNRTARNVRLAVWFDGDGRMGLVPDSAGLERALGRMLAAVHAAMVDGTWKRLKACANRTCGWIFYDRSRNRSRRWCSMDQCGNVMKGRSYRRRRLQRRRLQEQQSPEPR